jgi:outer membrane protein assembly factor BamB
VDILTGKSAWSLPDKYEEKPYWYYTSPIIVDNNDFIIPFEGGNLECRSIKDYSQKWSIKPFSNEERARGSQFYEPDVYFLNGKIILAAQKAVRCIDTQTGKDIWSTPFNVDYWECPRREIIGNSKGFLLMTNRTTYYFDFATGKYWLVGEYTCDAAFPSDDDVIMVSPESIVRYDTKKGKAVWKVEKGDGWQARHCWLTGRFFVTGTGWPEYDSPWTIILDVENGNVLKLIKGEYPVGGTISSDGQQILLVLKPKEVFESSNEEDETTRKEEGRLIALGTSDWNLLWSQPIKQYFLNGVYLLSEKDKVFVLEYDRSYCGVALRCIRPSDGQVLWNALVAGTYWGGTLHYYNTATLQRKDNYVIIIGHSAGGDYVETFREEDGVIVSKWESEKSGLIQEFLNYLQAVYIYRNIKKN